MIHTAHKNQLSLFPNEETKARKTIKYIGSKEKIIPDMIAMLEKLKNIHTILDGFSGSGRVSQSLSLKNYVVTANDLARYSFILARCFLLGNENAKIKKIIAHLNNIKGFKGWFSEKYGGYENETKKPFQMHNTQKLDAILAELKKFNLKNIEKEILLTSILIALDKVDSTLGHQSSYLKNWSSRSYKKMILEMPNFYNPYQLKHTIYNKNIFDICNIYHDVAYYDPPYGSNNAKMPASRVRYKCYYHIWETIVKQDSPETFGVNNRRVDSSDKINNNPFEDFRKTNHRYNSDIAIEDLIQKTNAKYILFSYNSNGRTSIENLITIFKKYTKILALKKIPYKKNIMATMNTNKNWQNNLENYEILILGKK